MVAISLPRVHKRLPLSACALGWVSALAVTASCVDTTLETSGQAGVAAAEVPATVRIATFNIKELSTAKLTAVSADGHGLDPQASAAAEIVKRVRPDILVLNEIDLDVERSDDLALNARRFADAYLATGPDSIGYPYAFAAPSNTGVLSGLDIDGDGQVATDKDRGTRAHGNDSYGYGTYPGQYAMAVLSRYPLDEGKARTFQLFRWVDLPGNHIPPSHYPPEVEAALRLSSKSHWDLPVTLGRDTLHLWVSHPTPPGFDGPEDRNGRRNFDEIMFWVLYADGAEGLVDDRGRSGGYASDAAFVIAGDLNARRLDGAVTYDGVTAIDQLLGHPRIQDPPYIQRPTASFRGGVRIDYVLPSTELSVVGGGVYDPDPSADPQGAARAELASDHRLVWVDIGWPPGPGQ